MNCNVVFKHLKELLKTDITQIPDYISEIIKDNPNDNYIELCEYIVTKHKSFIKDLENKLQQYVQEKQQTYDLVHKISNSNIISFTTLLSMIYYLNKDIKTLQVDNTRITALLDTLKIMNEKGNQ